MPLEPHEELKLAWEIAVMDMQLDRGRLDIEKIRQDIDKTRQDIDKTVRTLNWTEAASRCKSAV